MGSLVTVLRLLITGNSASAVASIGRMRAATTGLGATMMATSKRMAATGAVMTRYLMVPILAIGALAIHSASSFEASMKLIQTQCGGTAKDVRILTHAVEELATKGQHGPDELATALYHLKSVGMSNTQAIEALTQAEQLASVGQADMEATTNALAGAWRTGITGAQKFKQAVGTVNAIIGAGNLRMEEFNSAMGTGILITAKTFGLSLTDVGAALALFTSQGMPATASATRLRMAISLMAAPTAKAAETLKGIGLSTTDMAKAMRKDGLVGAVKLLKDHLQGMSKLKQSQILSAAFGGARTGTAVMALVDGYDTLVKKQAAVTAGQKNFGASVKGQGKTSAAAWAKLVATMHVVLDIFGKMLLPYLVRAAKWLQRMGKSLAEMSPGWQGFILKALLAAAAIGPILLILSKLILLFLVLKSAFTVIGLAGMGWIGLAIAIGIGLVLLYKKCAWFRAAVQWLGRALVWLWENVAKPVFHAIVAVVKWAWPYIVAIVKQKVAEVKVIIAGIRILITIVKAVWDKVYAITKAVWSFISGYIKGEWNLIKTIATTVATAVKDTVTTVWRNLKDACARIWEGITGVVRTAWNNIAGFVNKIIGAINWVLDKVPGIGGGLIPKLPTGGGGAKSSFSRTMDNGGMGGSAPSVGRGGVNAPGGVGQWLMDAWNALKTPWPDAPGGLFGGVAGWLLDKVKSAMFALFAKHAGPRQRIVDLAKSMVGVPYLWGGTSPAGFDCSGLLYWAYQKAGVGSFPRIPTYGGKQIGRSAIQPADVMFYYPGATQRGRRVPFGHFKMYIGNNQTVESASGGVQVRAADWAGAAQIRSYLTNGGFTNGPSLAGEQARELVIPWTKPRRAAQLLRASGLVGAGGGGINLTLQVVIPAGTAIVGSAEQVAEFLAPHLVGAAERTLARRMRGRVR